MSEELVKTAIERYTHSITEEGDLRELFRQDLEFLALKQWPDKVRQMREADIENGPRPCLTMDKMNQYLRQVVNDVRQNRPAIKVRAVRDATSDVAQVIQGLTRNIEDVSRADIAYDRAVEGAVGCGRGWFRILTEYANPMELEQDIRIASVPDPLSIVPDCDYREPDGSDMTYAFVATDLTEKQYKAEYGGNPKGFDWVDNWSREGYVRVAEYYKKTEEEKRLLVLEGGQVLLEDLVEEYKQRTGQSPVYSETRKIYLPKVTWYKINCHEILDETEWPGRWIPLIPVHGNEIWIDGRRTLSGMVRPAMDAQRLYNYSRSAYAELVALAPKAPFILAEGQIEDYEADWQRANRVNLSFLTYKPVDVAGHQVPPPQRQPMGANVPAGLVQDMVQAEHDIQSSLGMYAPSIGQPSNERSGKAILARQREGDVGSYHYRDNLGRSIRHAGRILVDLMPKVYDTRRVLRVVGEDGGETQVTLDPRGQQPVTQVRLLDQSVRKIYNIGLGTYDVTVSSGPGYTTKREEAANAILQLSQAMPNLFAVVGDLLVKSMDWPYADEIARRLRLMLPPNLQPAEEGKAPVPPEAQQKIQQLTQALQLLSQKAQEQGQEMVKLRGIVDGKVIDQSIKQQEAKVRMAELANQQLELQVDRERLVVEREKLMHEATEGRESREAEALARLDQSVGREVEVDGLTKVMQDGFSQMVQGIQQMQKAMQSLATGMQALGAKLDEHEGGRVARESESREYLTQALQGGETRSLAAIERMIQAAQTVAAVPEYGDSGELVGGSVLQRDGARRKVSLGE